MADKPAKKRAPRKTGHPPAKNPGGRPAGKNIANPAMLEKIARMWLQGWTVNAIAAACGLNWHTVDRHLKGTIRAAWKDHCAVNLIDDLALVKHLQWLAFQEFEKSQQPETRETIEKALLDGNADPQLVKHVVSTLDRTGSATYLDIVKWAVEFRAKVGRYYEAETGGADVVPQVLLINVKTREEAVLMMDVPRLKQNILEHKP
jgi:hypothetical protein